MYEIILTHRAVRDVNKIGKSEQIRIAKRLRKYAEDPIKFAQKLTNPKIGTFRFRIGDYRVIFDVVGNTIVILRVGHRKTIYKGI